LSEAVPFRLAILGADATTLALAKVVSSRTDLEITHLCDPSSAMDTRIAELLAAAAREAKPRKDWEALLDPGVVDGVLIAHGNDDERRSDQLRKFAQAAVPALISHPVVGDALLLYELDMIRRDTGAIIVPALADRQHPLIRGMISRIHAETGGLGVIHQCTIERYLTDRSKHAVLQQFAIDVDLLRLLCGELNQVNAMAAANEDAAYRNLIVQLSGSNQIAARWSVLSADRGASPTAKLTIVGGDRQVIVEMSPDDRSWSLAGMDLPEQEQPSTWDRHESILQRFLQEVQHRPATPDAADLLDAARAMELAGTIGRSLARRRTIDLYFEEHSEENTFKNTMAAGGCLLLMLGLFALPILAIMARAGVPGIGLWPWIMAGAFGLFVILQLLTLAFRK
jgi:predicted dehydrogenase